MATSLRLSRVVPMNRICFSSRWAHVSHHYRAYSSVPPPTTPSRSLSLLGNTYNTDEWTNIPQHMPDLLERQLHRQTGHPIHTTRKLIESCFPSYRCYASPRAGSAEEADPTNLPQPFNPSPIVSTKANFDALGFPPDHPGRDRSDTYYVNRNTVLRTHTSAHQIPSFRSLPPGDHGFLVSADVYRRDAIDRSHYPAFHQMEGAYVWDTFVPSRDGKVDRANTSKLAERIWADVAKLPAPPPETVIVDDPHPAFCDHNPVQPEHEGHDEVVKATAAHLKRSLECVMVEIMSAARKSVGQESSQEPIQARWTETTFPFTSPSYELEVMWQGEWLELLGSGVVKHSVLHAGKCDSRVGWAFGIGLERVAMLLFGIPDIRLFWSQDSRFLNQFSDGAVRRFVPFSKYPPSTKDVAFWIPAENVVHDNDVMEVVRGVVSDLAESVHCVDQFVHPKTGKKSRCYRIVYRSLERTLTHEEVIKLHSQVADTLVHRFGVELR